MTSRRAVQYAHDQPCTHQLLFRLVFFFKSNLLINTEARAQLFNLSAGGPSGSLHNSYSAAVQLFFLLFFYFVPSRFRADFLVALFQFPLTVF